MTAVNGHQIAPGVNKCSRNDCSMPAKYAIGFEAFPIGMSHTPRNKVLGAFNIQLCDSHAKLTKTEDLVNADGWDRMQFVFLSKGKRLLDRSTMKLVLKLIA